MLPFRTREDEQFPLDGQVRVSQLQSHFQEKRYAVSEDLTTCSPQQIRFLSGAGQPSMNG